MRDLCQFQSAGCAVGCLKEQKGVVIHDILRKSPSLTASHPRRVIMLFVAFNQYCDILRGLCHQYVPELFLVEMGIQAAVIRPRRHQFPDSSSWKNGADSKFPHRLCSRSPRLLCKDRSYPSSLGQYRQCADRLWWTSLCC